MFVCIGTLRDKSNNILGYRILDTVKRNVKDVQTSYIGKSNIRNLSVQDRTVICTEGNLDKYPMIQGNTVIKNNIPVVVDKEGSTISIANYEGKIVSMEEKVITQKINIFANADVRGNEILFKTTQHKDRIATQDSRSKASILEQIMGAKDIEIELQNFNMLDHYKTIGVSDNILKKPSELFTSVYGNTKMKAINDPNAYEFEIVKLEDRVELRSYKGVKYKGIVIVPDEVTHICKNSFSMAEASELIMPESVVYLGDHAFMGSKFKKVSLSSKVTAIPFGCFFESLIEEINLENITSIDNIAFCKSNIREVRIKAPIIQIGYEAFKDCAKLSVFEHAKTIEKIRHHAFEGCINLSLFDFESVTTIEQSAFNKTGIIRAKINGEVNYLQTSTFTGDIEEIEILSGMYKISANSVSNIKNKPILWTVPKSVTNIEKGTFKKQDTVMCYRKTVAASSAILDEANIVYLDELDRGTIPNIIKKAGLIDVSIEDILKDTLKSILDKEPSDASFEVNEEELLRANIPQEILDLVGNDFAKGKYATDVDFESESIKFKCILDHLSKVAVLDIMPFTKLMLQMKDTFNVEVKSGKLEVLYSDEISSVHRITYVDNKFTSISSSFIVAKTQDTLRYICMDNKYTDIMCENADVTDMAELFKILRPGDTIGLNSVISGVKYPEISCESSKTIEVTKGNYKARKKLIMNMYQALRYSSVTLKLDNNNIVLLVPGNKKIVKCASLGKTSWLNEKEETYKSLQCTIDSIEDMGSDTVFDYESTHKKGNYGTLIKRIITMRPSDYEGYTDRYSHIYKAEQSMYKHAGNYAHVRGMKSIEDVDMEFMMILFKTSLFEERKEEWLEGSIGKTIVEDAEHEFELSDGSTIYQYRTVKKTALRNKLMSGGDRKLYIFELVDETGIRLGVYISLYDITTLVNMCIEINRQSNNIEKYIFINKEHFDIVEGTDVIEIAALARDSKIKTGKVEAKYILGVYKPNGIYYIGLRVDYGKTFRFIPLIQVGELDVALEFIADTNKFGINIESMKYLYDCSLGALDYYISNKLHLYSGIRFSQAKYLALLKARELCIDGVSDIKSYNSLGLKEILKRCLGYTDPTFNAYTIPDKIEESDENDFDIDDADFNIDDAEFEIEEDDEELEDDGE